MEVGLYEAGYRHLHLDDCWAAKERNATGYSYPEKDHFPNGMKPVIDCAPPKPFALALLGAAALGAHSGCGSRGYFTPGGPPTPPPAATPPPPCFRFWSCPVFPSC